MFTEYSELLFSKQLKIGSPSFFGKQAHTTLDILSIIQLKAEFPITPISNEDPLWEKGI